MNQDIIQDIIYDIIYKDHDGTNEAFEEIYRDMQHNTFLKNVYEMMQTNQIRGNK